MQLRHGGIDSPGLRTHYYSHSYRACLRYEGEPRAHNLRQLVRGHLRGRARVHLAGDLHFYMRHSFKPQQDGQDAQGAAAAAAAGTAGATAAARPEADATQDSAAATAQQQHQHPPPASFTDRQHSAAAPGKVRKPHSFADLNSGISVTAASGSAAGEAVHAAAHQQQQQKRHSKPVPPKAAGIDKATIHGMYGDLLPQHSDGRQGAATPQPVNDYMRNGDAHASVTDASGAGRQDSGSGGDAACRDSRPAAAPATPQQPQQGVSPFREAAINGAHSASMIRGPGRVGGNPEAKGLACVPSLADGLSAVAGCVSDPEGRQNGMPRAASGDSLASAFAGAPPFTDSSSDDGRSSSSLPERRSSIGRCSSDGSEQIVWSPPRQPHQSQGQGGKPHMQSRPSAVRFGSVVSLYALQTSCMTAKTVALQLVRSSLQSQPRGD